MNNFKPYVWTLKYSLFWTQPMYHQYRLTKGKFMKYPESQRLKEKGIADSTFNDELHP